MKTSIPPNRNQGGFTFGEAMVAIGMAAVVGVAAGSMFLNGSILYAKNTAENLSHDQNRIAVNRLVRDIHAAVSTPQLGKIVNGNLAANPTAPAGSWTPYGTNKTFWAESGTGPSAGISFKKMGRVGDSKGGPFKVKNDPGNKDLIMIESGPEHPPYEGMEIVFPYYNMEGTIYKATSNGANHFNIWINGGLETRIKTKKDTNVICYYMSRYAYVIENGNLDFYSTSPPPIGVTWPVTIARNIVETPNPSDYTQVKVNNTNYSPSSVTITRGERVQWKFDNTSDRSVTSLYPHPASGPFNSGLKDNEDPHFHWSFPEVGTYYYTSSNDSSMVGTVVVVPASGSNVKPFSQSNPDYVTINLTTEDNRYSNRNYKAVNTLLAGSVPIRSKISKTQ